MNRILTPSTRYVAIALGCSLLLAQGWIGYAFTQRQRSAEMADAAADVKRSLAFSRDALNRALIQTDSLLASLPILIGEQVGAPSTAGTKGRILRAQADQNPLLRDILITSLSGDILLSAQNATARSPPPITPALLTSIQRQRTGGIKIGAPFRSIVTGEWSVLIGRVVRFPDLGEVIALAEASAPAIADQLGASISRLGMRIALSSDEGQLASVPHDEAGMGKTVAAPSTAQGGESIEISEDRILASDRLIYGGLALVAELPAEFALSEWRRDLSLNLRFAIVVILLEFAVAIGLGLYLNARLRAMAAAKQATQMLAASRAKAQEAADARGIFIANMNHELRTPLNAVIGFSEILTGELFGPIGNERYREYAADIHASGTHLLALINDIIDFSTIDMGHRKLDPEPLRVEDVIQDALRLLKPQIAARPVTVQLSGIANEDMILADSRGLRQVLLNVISNAIKFSPSGGLIIIRRDPDSSQGTLDLAIIDHGPGIADADIDRLGEQFYRTTSAMESAVGGAGLGLSISMSLLKLMGGGLSIKSQLSVGTTMTLHLPVPPPEHPAEGTAHETEIEH